MTEFIHLHNHTEYSLLDGMLRISHVKIKGKEQPSEFLKNQAERGVKAMAITDHGNMYGALEFHKNANEVGIKPIIGCEFYSTPLKYTVVDKNQTKLNHITVLSENLEGYHNLMRLNSAAWVDGFYYHPRIDFDLLSRHCKGLIVLSGCLKGELAQTAIEKGVDAACQTAIKYEAALGKDNYYIEIMDHGIPHEQAALKVLLEVSKRTGIPLVATNDCHYEKREDYEAHDIHICIASGKTLKDPKRLKMTTRELYFKTPQEMAKLFNYAPQALKNTLEIAEKCNVEFKKEGFVLPNFILPAEYKTPKEYLMALCVSGLKKKLKKDIIPPLYRERLDYEIGIISEMGFASYFLIVEDFISYARKNNIPVGPGRGSGAGSIVAYSIDITRVDPIAHKLLFERFLNPDRITMPDLDIDFSDEGRERVIDYVREKYGHANVGQIITFGTMKAKLALRDAARVMDISITDANRIAKLVPDALDTTLSSALETVSELREEINKDSNYKQLFENASKIEGLKRHTGVHAAGVLITKEEITQYSPLAKNSKGVITTQYEGETLVDLGLLKMDFLGLKTLTVIDNTIKLLKQLRGITLDIDDIPLDDKKTFDLLASAQTSCIFQLESGGMRDLIKRMKPNRFSDISALVALYRPGPMQSGMMDSFVNRKNGNEEISYDHYLLEPILKETHGAMVYQEQIMEISKSLAGFTPGEADTLRKAMSKKNPETMGKFRSKFITGAAKTGLTTKTAEKLFDQMAEFAGYGFNKSHSVAYSLITYQTAYLKANYSIEFMCAALTSEIGHNAVGSADKENKIATYLEETRKMNFEILPPSVSYSQADFTVEKTKDGKEAVRFGLNAIKNVGAEACKSIIEARKDGAFKSLFDLCQRINLNTADKRTMESLAMAGAFDALTPEVSPLESRAQIISEIETVMTRVREVHKERKNAADSLFGEEMLNVISAQAPAFSKAEPFTATEQLNKEREVLGLYFSGHPLKQYAKHLPKLVKTDIEQIQEGRANGLVEIAGIITRIKKRQTKSKDNWAQILIEDEKYSITANAFPRVWAELGGKIEINQAVIVSGKAGGDNLSARLEIALDNIEPVLSVLSRKAERFIINVPCGASEETIKKIEDFLNSVGMTEVYFNVDNGKNLIKTNKRITVSPSFMKFLDENLGENSWDFNVRSR
jgi:DNA polymerase-3 subunit alpha